MKKKIMIAGMAFMVAISASAQNVPPPPPPPEPPKAPIEELKAIPPSPPQAPVPPPPPPEITATLPDDYQDFLKRNPSVTAIRWTTNSVIITLKGGKTERYLLNDSETKEAEAKYGKLPVPPPPPPPPPAPPAPPKRWKRTLS